jgi:formate dehydrogenase major subunit
MREAVLEALYRVPFVVALSPTAGVGIEYASHVHMPTASFVEEEGVYVSADGRLTLARGTRTAKGALRAWEALSRLLSATGVGRAYSSAKDIWDELRRLDNRLSSASYDSIASGEVKVSLRRA